MKTNIKTQNYWMIKDFAIDRSRRPEVQGDKLIAIYKLIQKRGEPIKTADKLLNGAKALEIRKGEYIAMIRTGAKDKFYPCSLRTILLTDLKKIKTNP